MAHRWAAWCLLAGVLYGQDVILDADWALCEGDPEVSLVDEEAGLWAVGNARSPAFLHGTTYYVCHDGFWYSAPRPTGRWALAPRVPVAISNVAAGQPGYTAVEWLPTETTEAEPDWYVVEPVYTTRGGHVCVTGPGDWSAFYLDVDRHRKVHVLSHGRAHHWATRDVLRAGGIRFRKEHRNDRIFYHPAIEAPAHRDAGVGISIGGDGVGFGINVGGGGARRSGVQPTRGWITHIGRDGHIVVDGTPYAIRGGRWYDARGTACHAPRPHSVFSIVHGRGPAAIQLSHTRGRHAVSRGKAHGLRRKTHGIRASKPVPARPANNPFKPGSRFKPGRRPDLTPGRRGATRPPRRPNLPKTRHPRGLTGSDQLLPPKSSKPKPPRRRRG